MADVLTIRDLKVYLKVDADTGTYRGRPVDVAVMKDGSLLISDDYAGAIYRVTYNP